MMNHHLHCPVRLQNPNPLWWLWQVKWAQVPKYWTNVQLLSSRSNGPKSRLRQYSLVMMAKSCPKSSGREKNGNSTEKSIL